MLLLLLPVAFGNDECDRWAKEGECVKNPRFMLVDCREACLKYNGDSHEECEAWAEQGECSKNPKFMQLQCAESCGHQWVWVPSARRALELPRTVAQKAQKSQLSAKVDDRTGSLSIDSGGAAAEIIQRLALLAFHSQSFVELDEDDSSVVNVAWSWFAYAARLLASGSRAAVELVDVADKALVDDFGRVDWALRRFPTMLRKLAEIEAATTGRVSTTIPASDRYLKAISTKIPAIGVGTCWLSENQTEVAVATVVGFLRNHPELPAVHVDSAEAYGNEAAIGRALAMGGRSKKNVFLASKLSSESKLLEARERVEETLRNFGRKRVDLYSLHSPFSFRETPDHRRRLRAAWRTLVDMQKEGKIGRLGLSNFDEGEMRDFASDPGLGGLKMPDVLQNKFDPYRPGEQVTTSPGDPLVPLNEYGMTLVAYSTLSGWPRGLGGLDDPIVAQLANRRGWSPASLLLRWALDSGHAVIPRSKTPKRIVENLKVFYLPQLEQHELDTLNSIVRLVASSRNEPPPSAPDVFDTASHLALTLDMSGGEEL